MAKTSTHLSSAYACCGPQGGGRGGERVERGLCAVAEQKGRRLDTDLCVVNFVLEINFLLAFLMHMDLF